MFADNVDTDNMGTWTMTSIAGISKLQTALNTIEIFMRNASLKNLKLPRVVHNLLMVP